MVSQSQVKTYREKHQKIHLKIRALEYKMETDKPKRSQKRSESAYRVRQNIRKEQIRKYKIQLNKIDAAFEKL